MESTHAGIQQKIFIEWHYIFEKLHLNLKVVKGKEYIKEVERTEYIKEVEWKEYIKEVEWKEYIKEVEGTE